MSHFMVAVFTDNDASVEDMLAPYEESTENPMFLEWTPANTSMDDIIAKYNEEKKDDETLNDFAKRWYGYDFHPVHRNFGYVCNPNAKWDWFEVGGRWDGSLRLKSQPDKRVNEAPVSDIDFSPNEAEYQRAARFWEVVVEGSPLKNDEQPEDFRSLYNAQYYIDQYSTKENYAERAASLSVWAFVTPEDGWHENGSMGWWGFNDATRESRNKFSSEFEQAVAAHRNCTLTLVDCHI